MTKRKQVRQPLPPPSPPCPDCGHGQAEHYKGRDLIGCHTPVYLPKVRGIVVSEKRKGHVPCPCRRTTFDAVVPESTVEQGRLL